ncbi:hypothetical protein [Mycobacterium simiae]|uniref:hypothetical protein n=1 Tax=Mycobacterium simiae TaxID=1784 RepID=UPI00111C0997|nr:hypothetical protein [Mycobacterium simiae]
MLAPAGTAECPAEPAADLEVTVVAAPPETEPEDCPAPPCPAPRIGVDALASPPATIEDADVDTPPVPPASATPDETPGLDCPDPRASCPAPAAEVPPEADTSRCGPDPASLDDAAPACATPSVGGVVLPCATEPAPVLSTETGCPPPLSGPAPSSEVSKVAD